MLDWSEAAPSYSLPSLRSHSRSLLEPFHFVHCFLSVPDPLPRLNLVKGLRSAEAFSAAGLGSFTSSVLFSCTVAKVDFPLGPLDDAFAGVCSCCARDASSLGCRTTGGGVDDCGVAFCTLMVGAGVPSAFFAVVDDPRLELAPEGGGDFSLGDIGHCGVVSPLAPELLFGLEALVASVDAVPWRVGTFAADNARCMAAADGWVEMGVVRGCGLLSFRIGDVFLDVLGLVPAEVEDVVTSPPDSRFRNGGAVAVVGVVACEEAVLVSLVLRRGAELFAVAMLAASRVSAWPADAELLPEACWSGLLFAMMSCVCRRMESVCESGLFAHHTRQQSAIPGGHPSCFNQWAGARCWIVCGAPAVLVPGR